MCEQVANKMTRKYIGRIGDDPNSWIDATIDLGGEGDGSVNGRGIFWDRQVEGLLSVSAHAR